jgi:hypothetical protein
MLSTVYNRKNYINVISVSPIKTDTLFHLKCDIYFARLKLTVDIKVEKSELPSKSNVHTDFHILDNMFEG